MGTLELPLLDPFHGGDPPEPPPTVRDPERLAAVARDAGATQGSGAAGLVQPQSEARLCAWLRAHPTTTVLPQGALTSLTGGATPSGEVVISTTRMKGLRIQGQRAVAGPGLLLADLNEALHERDLFYPPAPTHDGASIGGNAATNAAGAATFRYGTTRDWVRRIRLALRHGEVLELRRGDHQIRPGDTLLLQGRRSLQVPIPRALSPALKKSSAGYFVRDPMDPIDLFLGSEGTLAIITEIELALLPRRELLVGLSFLPSTSAAVALTAALRRAELLVRSIEFFDRRCLQLVRDEGQAGGLHLTIPPQAKACLLFVLELAEDLDDEAILEQLSHGGLVPLAQALDACQASESTELALPGQARRQQQLAALREAIPMSASEFLLRHQRRDPAIHKLGGDMIVPFEHFGSMLSAYYRAFHDRGLDVAIWGHISDGNVHPNGLPRDADHMRAGEQALLALAQEVLSLGGCPLSEHGVGRHPLKQRMLALTRGEQGLRQLRATKRALDPGWTLAPGVLFPEPSSDRSEP